MRETRVAARRTVRTRTPSCHSFSTTCEMFGGRCRTRRRASYTVSYAECSHARRRESTRRPIRHGSPNVGDTSATTCGRRGGTFRRTNPPPNTGLSALAFRAAATRAGGDVGKSSALSAGDPDDDRDEDPALPPLPGRTRIARVDERQGEGEGEGEGEGSVSAASNAAATSEGFARRRAALPLPDDDSKVSSVAASVAASRVASSVSSRGAVARTRRFANFATRRRFSASARATSRADRAWATRSSSSSSCARMADFCVSLASLAREAEAPNASERRFFLARSASNAAERRAASSSARREARRASSSRARRSPWCSRAASASARSLRVSARDSARRRRASSASSRMARELTRFGVLASPLEETTHTGRRLPSISRLIRRHTPVTCAAGRGGGGVRGRGRVSAPPRLTRTIPVP